MYWLGRYLDPMTLTYILCSSAFYTFYVNVQYLLNYKAYNHQTLHSASPQCTDSAGTLTGWPWPIFHTPLTFTPFTSPFHMSSTVRPSTTKPYIALLLDVLTRQVPWPGDLDLYCALQWLWHILYWCSVSPQINYVISTVTAFGNKCTFFVFKYFILIKACQMVYSVLFVCFFGFFFS